MTDLLEVRLCHRTGPRRLNTNGLFGVLVAFRPVETRGELFF